MDSLHGRFTGFIFALVVCSFAFLGCTRQIATPVPPSTFYGQVWYQAPTTLGFPARYFQSSVVYNGAMWVIGGNAGNGNYLNDAWSSTNGNTWYRATGPAGAAFSARYAQSSLVYNGKMWVIGGYDGSFKNDVWSSSDGATWSPVTATAAFSPRAATACVVFNNAMYLIGGYSSSAGGEQNDVWTSTDGAVWSPVTLTANFTARDIFSSVVDNGMIWLFAGLNTKNYTATVFDDVWDSSDGANWSPVTVTNIFPARYGQSSVVCNGRLWVIAGDNGNPPFLNDVWSSTNGADWSQVSTGAAFSGRYAHTSLVFKSKIWVIAGLDSNLNPLSDVWYSP